MQRPHATAVTTAATDETPPEIIYDDDQIRIMFQPGGSDFLLVTFGDLDTPADGRRFFADVPVRKTDTTCIGIVAKSFNWFPKSNMEAALGTLLPILGQYSSRVVYGGSAGAYAAIKHSRLLGATEVIALCPQWSIDTAECEGHQPGWEDYFIPSMAGMGIRHGDVGGAIFLFVDMLDQRDSFHCRMVCRADPGATVINMPSVGHHVTSVIAGTQNLATLIQLCRSRSVMGLIQLGRSVRRKAGVRTRAIVDHALRRYPRLLARSVMALPRDEPLNLQFGATFMRPIVARLLANARNDEARDYIETFRTGLRDPVEQVLAVGMLAQLTHRQFAIHSFHGTMLVYDAIQRRCVHTETVMAGLHCLVCLHLTVGSVALFAELGGCRIGLSLDAAGELSDGYRSTASGTDNGFELHAHRDGWLSFKQRGTFLSAVPDGQLVCNRDCADGWESFQLRLVG